MGEHADVYVDMICQLPGPRRENTGVHVLPVKAAHVAPCGILCHRALLPTLSRTLVYNGTQTLAPSHMVPVLI